MNFTLQQVESITQRVLQELRSRGIAVQSTLDNASTSSSTTSAESQLTSRSTGRIEVRGRIITEDILVAANTAGQSISIATGAVVTPSARDYIRQNKISLASSPSSAAANLNGVAVVSASNITLQAALKTSEWSVVSAAHDFHAATEVATTENTMMLCSVQQPSVTACLLNRSQRFRAAVVHPSDDFTALQSTMSPNVICLSPTGWSIAGLMSLLKGLSVGSTQPSLWKEIRS